MEKKRGHPVIEGKVQTSLDLSKKEGVAAAVQWGAGYNFISPFAIAMNATNAQIGLLSAVPNLIAPLFQLKTSKLMEKQKRKKIIVEKVFLELIMWIPIMLLSLFFILKKDFNLTIIPLLLILFYTFQQSFRAIAGPAWSSLMKDLTEKVPTGKYFGIRNRVTEISSLAATLIAGFILDFLKDKGVSVFYGFIIIFSAAMIGRFISWIYFKKHYEPKLKMKRRFYYFSFWQFLKKAPSNNFGLFVIYTSLMSLVVNIASPFFAVYMLKDLQFSYTIYTLLSIVCVSAATIVTMPLWGKYADRFGNVRMMKMCGLMVPFVPLLWLVSASPFWLFFVQIFSGIVWAGYGLAVFNFTYDTVSRERMSLCTAYHSIISGAALFIGANIGGILTSLNISFMNVILFVFLISGILRLLISLIFLRNIVEVREVAKPSKRLWGIPDFLNVVRRSSAVHQHH